MARQSLSPMKDLDDAEGSLTVAGNADNTIDFVRRRRELPITHLKYLRKKNGLTLEALSQITSISISYLSRLESGARRLNTDLIKRLSRALGCDPAELLTDETHEGRVVSPAEFARRRRGEFASRENAMPLYYITQDEVDSNKLSLKIAPPLEWKNRPSELAGKERVFALRADEYFLPYFGKTSTLYLESAQALSPEATILMLSCGTVVIKKVWSVAPISLQVCDITEIESIKKGENMDKLQTIQRADIDFMYKVVGFSDFNV